MKTPVGSDLVAPAGLPPVSGPAARPPGLPNDRFHTDPCPPGGPGTPMRILLMILAPAVLLAQNATLSGLVKDSNQPAIPEASLIVYQVEAGIEKAAKSNSSGLYALPSLAPGHYKITVEARGFQVKTIENVELQPEQNARLDITLEGTAAEIHGSIADVHGGEALAGIQIQLAGTPWRVTSDAVRRFRIGGIPPGDYVLNVSTVGYHMEKHALHLDAGATMDLSVILTPDTLRQTETVDAKAIGSWLRTPRTQSPSAPDKPSVQLILVPGPKRWCSIPPTPTPFTPLRPRVEFGKPRMPVRTGRRSPTPCPLSP